MSTADELRKELTALEAERKRLDVVDSVLTDMVLAAGQARKTKQVGDDAAERAKLRHWDAAAPSVWDEQTEAGRRWREVHGQWFAEVTARTSRMQAARGAAQTRAQGVERSR
ncbi:hypothetical protein KHQ06_08115 [Nocardia tengchongensis]|uniref:Uncharacterized protein n=1 Tax=Nocardia tengchongensis TaxID=2055889 RepID=A0ABX8CTP2_9NOCA|nr:hypothetical protein [Nocardia tengchongensis]QVI22917.1 hypothetical protein KHQ06_08115 [Nocardia tengchongensis]